MTSVNIEVSLTELLNRYGRDDEPMTIADALVNVAAGRLLDELGRDEVLDRLRNKAREVRDDEITASIRPLVQQAIAESLQPTDSYGKPKGEPTTLAEVITKAGKDALTAEKSNGTGYGRNKKLIQIIIEEEVQRALGSELRAALEQAKADVTAAVREQGAQLIADTITRMAGAK